MTVVITARSCGWHQSISLIFSNARCKTPNFNRDCNQKKIPMCFWMRLYHYNIPNCNYDVSNQLSQSPYCPSLISFIFSKPEPCSKGKSIQQNFHLFQIFYWPWISFISDTLCPLKVSNVISRPYWNISLIILSKVGSIFNVNFSQTRLYCMCIPLD